MREADLERAVLQLAGLLGWRRAHFRPAMLRSGRWATHMAGDTGFPDLVLAREGRLLFVELKSEKGKTTPEQDHWLAELGDVPGVVALVWRPADWTSGEIDRVLQKRSARW